MEVRLITRMYLSPNEDVQTAISALTSVLGKTKLIKKGERIHIEVLTNNKTGTTAVFAYAVPMHDYDDGNGED